MPTKIKLSKQGGCLQTKHSKNNMYVHIIQYIVQVDFSQSTKKKKEKIKKYYCSG